MKLMITSLCVAAFCGSLAAQAGKTEIKSKVTVKDGKDVKVTGCVQPATTGPGFVLTNVADKKGTQNDYMLVSHESELSKHVGHRVQISGKATDRGDAKVETEITTKTKVEHGKDQEVHSKSEEHGNQVGNYLGVDSVKMIAATCP